MEIIRVQTVEDIVQLIQTNAKSDQSYTNKLPLDDDALYTFLKELMDTTGIFALKKEGTIQMVMTCDPYFKDRYKVIGPIIQASYRPTGTEFNALFHAMTAQHNEGSTYYFAFASNNEYIKPFMKSIGASYTFTDYHLEATQDIGESQNLHHIVDYQKAYFRSFQKLHESTFKYHDMTAAEIEASLDEQHQLFLYMAEGILKGYLYLIFDTAHHHAEIKYFSSHTDYRLKGIAFDLIQHAIHYSLKGKDIDRIYFKIRSKNQRLVDRFHELGFHISSEYKKFKLVDTNNENN